MEPATRFAGCWMLDGMRGDDEREDGFPTRRYDPQLKEGEGEKAKGTVFVEPTTRGLSQILLFQIDELIENPNKDQRYCLSFAGDDPDVG
jgi:hypothetical protein